MCFFSEEDINKHMKERHEECFVCKRKGIMDALCVSSRAPPDWQQAADQSLVLLNSFQNYQQLESHFGKDHYPCYDASCLEKKFVVFGSEMDLKVHQLAEVSPLQRT